jgi:hypothetical protein
VALAGAGIASASVAATAATAEAAATAPEAPAAVRGPLSAFAATPGAGVAPEEAAASEGAAAGREDETAAGEEYGRQLLHLFHGSDGVQAYIRDAELTGARLRTVAAALAAELGAGGTRLAALTVNGRRVTVRDGDRHDDEQPATASEAAPLPIIEKGTI